MLLFIKTNARRAIAGVLFLLCAANIIIWSDVAAKENQPDMLVSFFDVGQGDAELIQTRDGTKILIDGGPDSKILSLLAEKIPYYDRNIDIVIATHPHKDHITGLIDVMKRFHVGVFIDSGVFYNTTEIHELEGAVAQNGARHILADQPMKIIFYKNAALNILAPLTSFASSTPKNIHDAMIVSELNFENKKILFMGDTEKKLEQQLLSHCAFGYVDILKVGHHGSKTSTTAQLLAVINPHDAIISVGKNNFGHPNQGVMNRLLAIGTNIFRTDVNGSVDASIFQYQINVASQKQFKRLSQILD